MIAHADVGPHVRGALYRELLPGTLVREPGVHPALEVDADVPTRDGPEEDGVSGVDHAAPLLEDDQHLRLGCTGGDVVQVPSGEAEEVAAGHAAQEDGVAAPDVAPSLFLPVAKGLLGLGRHFDIQHGGFTRRPPAAALAGALLRGLRRGAALHAAAPVQRVGLVVLAEPRRRQHRLRQDHPVGVPEEELAAGRDLDRAEAAPDARGAALLKRLEVRIRQVRSDHGRSQAWRVPRGLQEAGPERGGAPGGERHAAALLQRDYDLIGGGERRMKEEAEEQEPCSARRRHIGPGLPAGRPR